MKGFIKVTNLRNQVQYLNIDYIIKFSELPSKNGIPSTVIRITSGQETATIVTAVTAEEIVDMIDLAKS